MPKQDHSFKVVNGRTGKTALETPNWNDAANCQYRNNEAETRVGYPPVFTLWIVDQDGIETKVQSQL